MKYESFTNDEGITRIYKYRDRRRVNISLPVVAEFEPGFQAEAAICLAALNGSKR